MTDLLRLWIFALVGAAATTAVGRDIFVSNAGGDDRNDGQLEGASLKRGPVATINYALSLARTGDRVVLMNTGIPYRESISLSGANHCGAPGAPFILEGRGAVLDGANIIPVQGWEGFGEEMWAYRPNAKSYQQLFTGAQALARRHVVPGVDALPALQPNEWCLHERRIYFRPEQGKSPLDYDLRCAGLQTGLTLYQVHDVEVHNLVVRGFWLDGINAHDGVRKTQLIGVTCQSNGRSGIAVCGSSRCDVYGATVSGNGTAQVYTEGLAVADFHKSNVANDTAPAFVSDGGQLTVDDKPVQGVR